VPWTTKNPVVLTAKQGRREYITLAQSISHAAGRYNGLDETAGDDDRPRLWTPPPYLLSNPLCGFAEDRQQTPRRPMQPRRAQTSSPVHSGRCWRAGWGRVRSHAAQTILRQESKTRPRTLTLEVRGEGLKDAKSRRDERAPWGPPVRGGEKVPCLRSLHKGPLSRG